MARLEDVIPKAEGETILVKKTFKDSEPCSVYVDIKYLPQMKVAASSKSVTAREYRQEKSFERTKQSPQGKDLAALSQKA